MGDHIHPHFEGMWAASTRSEIHIMITPPWRLPTLGNHIHPPLEGTWETTFNLHRRESGPLPLEVRYILGPPLEVLYISGLTTCVLHWRENVGHFPWKCDIH